MRTVRGIGWLVAGALALVVGVGVATLVVGGTVAENCPGYDDEGETAAPASPYARVLCGGLGTDSLSGIVIAALVSLAAAGLVAVVLARRSGPAPLGALTALLVGPSLVLLALHLALPEGCVGPGADQDVGRGAGSACQRDRELL